VTPVEEIVNVANDAAMGKSMKIDEEFPEGGRRESENVTKLLH
jgi:hypothetical protein